MESMFAWKIRRRARSDGWIIQGVKRAAKARFRIEELTVATYENRPLFLTRQNEAGDAEMILAQVSSDGL